MPWVSCWGVYLTCAEVYGPPSKAFIVYWSSGNVKWTLDRINPLRLLKFLNSKIEVHRYKKVSGDEKSSQPILKKKHDPKIKTNQQKEIIGIKYSQNLWKTRFMAPIKRPRKNMFNGIGERRKSKDARTRINYKGTGNFRSEFVS